jgi:glycosidase
MRFLLFLILLNISGPANSQTPERIEPPNWWVGMHNPNLQIMLYGQDVGLLKPEIKAKGIKLLKFNCPENKNYLFIDISIDAKCKAGEFPIKLYKDDEVVSTIQYKLESRQPNSATRQGFNGSDAIYMITPDRFANGDESNDSSTGMKEVADRANTNGRHGGDLDGIRQHLDYIADMGFTTVWINPVLENNMTKYSYHGYAITDFYKVDPRMGNNQSYKALCEDAHKRGMKIMMDGVVNHCGSLHWWMSDPPTLDWINYYQQEYVETNHRKTLQPDPHAAAEDLAVMENGWFVKTMPDLNVTNPWMSTYLIQNSIWWIEYAGIDGVRMDTYLYPEQQFMSNWSKAVMEEYPHFNITGEVWHDQPSVLAYWQKGKINANGYKSYLPSLIDFPLQFALVKALNNEDKWNGGWIQLYETLALDFEYADPNNLVVFADNHDISRIYAQLGENVDKVKLVLAYLLTIRGIPEIYYGTEILMSSPTARDDGRIRSDFPGGWKGDAINAFTGEGLTSEQKDMQLYLKRILHWRKNTPVIHNGLTTHYVPQKGVYVYFRYNAQQKIMVVLNKNAQAVELELSRFKSMIGEYKEGTEIITDTHVSLMEPMQLPATGAMIIECKMK